MSDETRQAIRDCAAIVEFYRPRVLLGFCGARSAPGAIGDEIMKKWPDAFKDKGDA